MKSVYLVYSLHATATESAMVAVSIRCTATTATAVVVASGRCRDTAAAAAAVASSEMSLAVSLLQR